MRLVVEIVVDAQCESAWNTQILSGTYQAIGGFGDYAFYQNQTPDANGNWWYFHFDAASNGWNFAFAGLLVPGQTAWETVISPFNNQPGESLNTRYIRYRKINFVEKMP